MGKTRSEAIARMKRALDEMRIEGIQTNIPFHQTVLDDDTFNTGQYTTDFVVKQEYYSKSS